MVTLLQTAGEMASPPTLTFEGKSYERDESKMEIVHFTDKGGKQLRMQKFNNKYYNAFYDPDTLGAIKSFKLRDDDIYFPGFLRTGTNWTYERLSMLIRGKAETIQRNKTTEQIEIRTSQDYEKEASPRIICAHMCMSDAPDELAEKKCKVIYTLRDPKDVAVSLYHLYEDLPYIGYKGAFRDFLYLYMDGKVDATGMFSHLRDAEQWFDEHPDVPVHIQVYEEALQNPLEQIQKLSDFLNLPRNNQLCQEIVDKCKFERLKADKDNFAFKIGDRSILFRKGTNGDWRNYFTEEMLKDYYRVYEEKMAGSRFYNLYSRDKDC